MQFRRSVSLCATAAAFCLLLFITANAFGEKVSAPAKVAVVNGTAITEADLDRELVALWHRLSAQGSTPTEDQLGVLKKNALERLVNRELLYQASVKTGTKVDEEKVKERIGDIRDRYSSDEDYRDALAKMNLTDADLKIHIQKDVAIEKFVDEKFVQKTNVSDEEIKDYYEANPDAFVKPEQVRARHILIKVDSDASEAQKTEAREKIEEIKKKVGEGGDFESLAKEFSEGPSAVRGGDLGYFQRGQMVKPFEDVAFAMKPGETSDVVETQFGYHLINVVDRQPERTISYEEVKEKLEDHMKEQRVRSEVGDFLQRERDKATVEIFLEEKSK